MSSLELWPIGNCQVSALLDDKAQIVWGCIPRVDGDPLFSALLGGDAPETGFWSIVIENPATVSMRYERNTAVLVSTHVDEAGNGIEIVDFCPYFRRLGRSYRPVAFARIVRPVGGAPRICVRLRPARNWGEPLAGSIGGTNHIRFAAGGMTLRLTTTAPVG